MHSSDDVVERLDELIQLMKISNNLAALAATGVGSQKDRIILLDKVGYSSRAIADLLGTTPNTVSVLLSARKRERKQGKTKGRERKKRAAEAAGVTADE